MEQEFLEFHQLVEDIYEQRCKQDEFVAALHKAAERKIVLWSSNLMALDESARMRFFLDLMHLEIVAKSMLHSGELAGFDDDRKAFFCLLHTLLCNYSDDLLMLYHEYPCEAPVHISCGACGNDVHSVLVNPAVFDEKNKTTVVPREYDAESDGLSILNISKVEYFETEDGEYREAVKPLSVSETPEGFGEPDCDEWDIFTNIMRYLNACDEKYLSGILRYFYGEHKCGKCGESEVVMASYKRWFKQNRQNFAEPSDEAVKWIMEVAKKTGRHGQTDYESCYDSDYAQFMYRMAAWYGISRNALDEKRVYDCILKSYEKSTQKNAVFVKVLQHIIRKLPDNGYEQFKARAYNCLARSVSFEYHKKDEPKNRWDLSFDAYMKSLKIQQDAGLYDEPCYWNTLNGMCLIVAESGREEYVGQADKVEELILSYIKRKEGQKADTADIGEAYNRLAYMFAESVGDFEKCYDYFGRYIEIARQIYGDDSDYVADLYEELADYYEDDGKDKEACELREKALEINIREMGKMYLLPPIFKRIVLFAAKVTKAIDADDKFSRVMSAAGTYAELGESYYSLELYSQAMDCCEKAQALYEWEFKNGSLVSDMAKVHQIKGDIYRDTGESESADKEYEIALDICNSLLQNSQYEYELEECEEIIVDIKERLNLE